MRKKSLSLRQIAVKKVHPISTIQKNLKRAGVRIRVPGHNYGNPAQLKFGSKKVDGKVLSHQGERLVVLAIMDFSADGLTYRQIAQSMTALKISTRNGKVKWHPEMVKRILESVGLE